MHKPYISHGIEGEYRVCPRQAIQAIDKLCMRYRPEISYVQGYRTPDPYVS